MNNRHVKIRTNVWRAIFIFLVLWLLLFHSEILERFSFQKLFPDVSSMDDIHTIAAYAIFGIVLVAVVKLLSQSR